METNEVVAFAKHVPIALITFILGGFTGFLLKQWQIKNKMESTQEFLSFWIDEIEDVIKKQASGYMEYAAELRKADPRPVPLSKFNLHIDKLKAITPIDLVRTFITNKSSFNNEKNKLLYDLTSEIDFIGNLQISGDQILAGGFSIATEIGNEWDMRITDLNMWFNDILSNHQTTLGTDIFLKSVFETRQNWINHQEKFKPEDAQPIEWTKKFFLDKLDPILEKEIHANPNNHLMLNLIPLIAKLNTTYQRKILNMGNVSNIHDQNAQNLLLSYDKLKGIKNELVKIKFRWFIFLS